jgi:solute carrier family 25 carnitine/acylcarnitine transporter 20/29
MTSIFNKDFINGLYVGTSQVLIGYPFDTIKVVLQSGYQKIGWSNLYRGVKYPLLSNSIINSSLFGFHTGLLPYFNNNHFITGSLTGFIGAFIICPVEQLKIRAQLNHSIKQPFFRALIPTIMRESPAYSLYFGLYDYLHYNKGLSAFFAGSFAGVSSWLFTYPCDIYKTQSQAGKPINLLHKYAWSALPITLARAFIVNGISFTLYDFLKE